MNQQTLDVLRMTLFQARTLLREEIKEESDRFVVECLKAAVMIIDQADNFLVLVIRYQEDKSKQ